MNSFAINWSVRVFWAGPISSIRKGSESYETWLQISAHSHETLGLFYISIFTELYDGYLARNKLVKLHKLAYFDELTGLANRNHFMQFIESSLESQSIDLLALLFIDLDKFKTINDQYGHQEGDWVLKMVASRIKSIIGESNFASRLAGDEFVVVLSEIKSRKEAFKTAEILADQISKPYENDVVIHTVTASIGIAFYPLDGENVKELLNKADLAMYQAKNPRDAVSVYAFNGSD